jgi:CheY-like chemotaxis protein
LAELQGGQIGLSSVLGQGTTFTFYVQAQRCKSDSPGPSAATNVRPSDTKSDHPRLRSPTDNPTKSPQSSLTLPEATAASEINPQTLHILAVEDNKINQTVLVRQLRRLGCTVHTADHGLEALELLNKSTFHRSPIRDSDSAVLAPPVRLDVILMDIEMPIMDGLTCVRRIREMEKEGTVTHVPVIAVTANARSDQILGAMEAGMVGHNLFVFVVNLIF